MSYIGKQNDLNRVNFTDVKHFWNLLINILVRTKRFLISLLISESSCKLLFIICPRYLNWDTNVSLHPSIVNARKLSVIDRSLFSGTNIIHTIFLVLHTISKLGQQASKTFYHLLHCKPWWSKYLPKRLSIKIDLLSQSYSKQKWSVFETQCHCISTLHSAGVEAVCTDLAAELLNAG